MNRFVFPVLFLALFGMTACSSVLPKGAPAPRLYTLNAPEMQPRPDQVISTRLQVLLPQATPGLETERIVLRNTDNRVDYFADTKWTGTLTTLVQSLVVEGFDNTQQLEAVGSDLVAINPNYNLLVEIRDFQAEYLKGQTNPRARIRLTVKLIKADTHDIVITRTYDERETATGNTLQEIIPAFDLAWQRTATRLINDTIMWVSPK